MSCVMGFVRRVAILTVAGLVAFPAAAGEARVAVAANFTATAETLAAGFEAESGNTVSLSFGATGALYAQIAEGAPFDVFLAADTARPERAVAEGLAVKDSLFTYALGRLALYSTSLELADATAVLRDGDFTHIAIADPVTAPYGAAAMDALAGLGLKQALAGKLVTGTNVTQTLQFIKTGNAELGFVALSQVADAPAGDKWRVPENLYRPIRQGAVLTRQGAENPAALGFVDFLKSASARAIIAAAGYGTEG